MELKIKEWLYIIITFIAIFYFYAFISYFGMEEFIKEGVLKDYLNSNLWHLELIITGVLFGSYFILINRLTDHQKLRKKSYGFNILLKSTLYLISLLTVVILVYYLFLIAELTTPQQMETYKKLFVSRFALSFVMFYAIVILLLNFFLYINKKLGPGNLVALLTGKYYHPRNEELIFLFLDLKGSTSHSEILGHNKYSRFLKECIHELTPIIHKYDAKIYQYVGDEVVLYWKKNKGLHQLACLDTFFEFNDKLERRKDHFFAEYGKTPEFKAGIDVGIVTATEIGDIKREIAYHGDTLNIASRLEGKCNQYNKNLIISENLKSNIPTDNRYHYEFLSDLPLRGKSEHLKFFGVQPM